MWHLKMVVALGITWLLDGLQVTLTGSLAGILKEPLALGLTDVQIGASATAYLSGAVTGALFFGWLTDRLGRKKLFLITLALYLGATALTACAWNFASFLLFQALTGSGIGGEYAAINSAIDELIPAAVRGNVDLVVNATFWLGAALGALCSFGLLNTALLPATTAWRLAYGIGAVLGLVILFLRRHVPESPRWLMLRGQDEEADRIVTAIETDVTRRSNKKLEAPQGSLKIHVRDFTPLSDVWRSMIRDHPKRSLLGLCLMVAQSFFYNSVFFTYGLVLTTFFGIKGQTIPLHILPLAIGNFCGPLVLGRFFDSLGRKKMITATYALTAFLTVACAIMFMHNDGALAEAIWFTVIFFVASSAASSAYLTVSEVFPLEIRAFAISIFYAIGTLAGGVAAPSVFARLVATNSREYLAYGYFLASALMLVGAIAEWLLGIDAEGKSLESISTPLQASS
jgi:MFS family permease